MEIRKHVIDIAAVAVSILVFMAENLNRNPEDQWHVGAAVGLFGAYAIYKLTLWRQSQKETELANTKGQKAMVLLPLVARELHYLADTAVELSRNGISKHKYPPPRLLQEFWRVQDTLNEPELAKELYEAYLTYVEFDRSNSTEDELQMALKGLADRIEEWVADREKGRPWNRTRTLYERVFYNIKSAADDGVDFTFRDGDGKLVGVEVKTRRTRPKTSSS